MDGGDDDPVGFGGLSVSYLRSDVLSFTKKNLIPVDISIFKQLMVIPGSGKVV
mgnify:CR=1 FL=1